MILIAVDPGKKGGIAWSDGKNIQVESMPETQGDVLEIFESLKMASRLNNEPVTCFMEQVGGFTGNGQPGSSMFKFGEGFGFLKGVIQTLGLQLIMVRPQKWQKYFSLGTASACSSDSEWKNKLKAEAQRRYPQLKLTLETADALLILDYARANTATQN